MIKALLDAFPQPDAYKDEILTDAGTHQSYRSNGKDWVLLPKGEPLEITVGAESNKYAFATLLNEQGFDPYIVVGVGRCGTSTVSSILHHKLDVCMGIRFGGAWNKLKSNMKGFWEDVEISVPGRAFVFGKLNYTDWIDHILYTAAKRKETNKPWGFKDTRTAYFLGFYLAMFRSPRIIYCKRDKDLVVKSLTTHYSFTPESASTFYDQRTMFLDNVLDKINADKLVIGFGKCQIPDTEIIEQLQGKWEDLKCI